MGGGPETLLCFGASVYFDGVAAPERETRNLAGQIVESCWLYVVGGVKTVTEA